MKSRLSSLPLAAVALNLALTLPGVVAHGDIMTELWSTPPFASDFEHAYRFLGMGQVRSGSPGLLFAVPAEVAGSGTSFGALVLVHGPTGQTEWVYTPSPPHFVVGDPYGDLNFGPQLKDLNADGLNEVLFMTSDWRLHCFTFSFATPTLDPSSPSEPPAPVAKPFGVGPSIPNPASEGVRFALSVPAPTPIDISIFDVSGRIVRAIHQSTDKAGDLTLRWDGLDDGGRSVAAGSYFYRVRTNAGETARRVIWIR